ncbi:MAG: hypothetical protein INR71_02160 [Terriglobus roseus]|nr:hypothetical protein [Terriglobus roseus]
MMVTITTFLLIYLLGGLTFVPLILAAVYLHWWSGQQRGQHATQAPSPSGGASSAHDLLDAPADLPEELKKLVKSSLHEADVAAGYFAVCREYVPGGVNGKPPERTTPAGGVVANESPSVYQSMYRGIFGRDKNAAPTIQNEAGKGSVKVKKGRNVFYVVLRLGHLMLYDDIEQLEVRHVISLAHHGVDIYGGGETIPEGELFVKRNCIRLTSRRISGELSTESRPFYLFSDNCSEKEDFYHALLQNQERREGSPDNPPKPLEFEQAHLVKLVQQLHADEESLQTRWFNALLGRIFLGLYKTPDVEEHIRSKITKKISRVQKPNFISSIAVGKMHVGDAAPLFTNPKLREITMAGDITVEADVKYSGGFRLEIAAVARIDLGKRMGGAREVNVLLAAVLKKLEGHLLFRLKPPPSNRLWFSFETAPKMELSIEPVVATRQITYGFILRAIESRIREVLAETLVSPNYDDVPYYNTLLQRFRGGLWEDDVKPAAAQFGTKRPSDASVNLDSDAVAPDDRFSSTNEDSDISAPGTPQLIPDRAKNMSTPFLTSSAPIGLSKRARAKSRTTTDLSAYDAAASSALDLNKSAGKSPPSTPNGPNKPRALRSHSFASPTGAQPMLNSDPITIESKGRSGSGGASSLKGINAHISALSGSPRESPVGSPERSAETAEYMRQAVRSKHGSVGSARSILSVHSDADSQVLREEQEKASSAKETTSSVGRTSIDSLEPRSLSHSRNASTDALDADRSPSTIERNLESWAKQAKRSSTLKAIGSNAAAKRQSLTAATNVARRWGLGMVASRQHPKDDAASSSQTSVAAQPSDGPVEASDEHSEDDPVSASPATSSTAAGRRVNKQASSASLQVEEPDKDLERAPSPSMIPRRVSSNHSLSSTSSASTSRANRQPSPNTSKIPTLSPSPSNLSLNKSVTSPIASSPSLTPSSFSNPALAPTQQEIDARIASSHTRKPSIGVAQGPGSPSMPLGRGQPLPPPGKPLPGPRSGTWVGAAGAILGGMRRKPVGAGSRSGSVDEGKGGVRGAGKQELEAKRRIYEQEKHHVGSGDFAVSEGPEPEARTAGSPKPPPLPKRPGSPAGDAETADVSEMSAVGAMPQATKRPPSLPERKTSLPVAKRPVPKPPLPARKAAAPSGLGDEHEAASAPQPSDSSKQDDFTGHSGGHEGDAAAHTEDLENLEPDAVLADEEDLATAGPTEDETREPTSDADVRADAKGLALQMPLDDGNDDDEAFGPMEMNVPESPAKGAQTGTGLP